MNSRRYCRSATTRSFLPLYKDSDKLRWMQFFNEQGYPAPASPGDMARKLKLGIRELVEFCCRDGDLGYDDAPGVRALEGLLTHQKIQKRYRDRAQSEVSVKLSTRIGDLDIELGGCIEESKTVYAHLPAHWNPRYCNNPESLEQLLQAFWEDMENSNAST